MPSTTLAPTARTPAWRWLPQRVVFTPAALETAHGQAMHAHLAGLGLPIEHLPPTAHRPAREGRARHLPPGEGDPGGGRRPAEQAELSPIPPPPTGSSTSRGLPRALPVLLPGRQPSGPPVVRAYANLPEILAATRAHDGTAEDPRSFEVSCYPTRSASST